MTIKGDIMKRKSTIVPALIAAMVALAVAAAISTATIPDSGSGLIHGCYAPSAAGQQGGSLSVIDGGAQECAEGATALSWQSGPAVVAFGEGSAGCSYTKSTTVYCGGGEELTFTPSQDAICRVSLDGQIISKSGESDAKLAYNLAYSTETGGNKTFGPVGLSTTTGTFNTDKAATIARTANLAVEAEVEYELEDKLEAISSSGTAYINETYFCVASG